MSHKNIGINNADEAFYLNTIEHNKKIDYYPVKWQFKIVFNDSQYCQYVTSNLYDNKTVVSWSNFLEKVIDDFKNKGYTFNRRAEMDNITIANNFDMSYNFYSKHYMHVVETKKNQVK